MNDEKNLVMDQTSEVSDAVSQTADNQSAPESNGNGIVVCAFCGTELTENKVFCTNCGHKKGETYSPQPNSPQVSDAISQFNQNIVQQEKKKKSKSKALVVILIIVGILAAAAIGGYVHLNGMAESIIDEIKSSDPSYTIIESNYNSLTPIGQMLFRDKIIDAFVDEVSDNQYVELSGWLVNTELLEKYEMYDVIGGLLRINSSDGTNVRRYISQVLELSDYVKYNGVSRCVLNSMSDCSECIENVTSAAKSSSYYVTKLYAGYAHTSAENAVAAAKEVSTGDELCVKYISALSTIETELGDLYYGTGYYSSKSVNDALDTISEMATLVSDASDSVESIVSGLPVIN